MGDNTPKIAISAYLGRILRLRDWFSGANVLKCREHFRRLKVRHGDRTGWLGRQDSNLGMAESKSDHFALVINRHSEKDGKFGHNSINRLGRISERGSPRHGHAITRKRPQAREFFSAPSPLNIETYLTTRQSCPSLVPASRKPSLLFRAPAT